MSMNEYKLAGAQQARNARTIQKPPSNLLNDHPDKIHPTGCSFSVSWAPQNRFLQQGSLKDTCCPFETACSTNIKGSHHLQGNAQVQNVRIPVQPHYSRRKIGGPHGPRSFGHFRRPRTPRRPAHQAEGSQCNRIPRMGGGWGKDGWGGGMGGGGGWVGGWMGGGGGGWVGGVDGGSFLYTKPMV